MFRRRAVIAGGLAMAAAASSTGIVHAHPGKPMLVFVGHAL